MNRRLWFWLLFAICAALALRLPGLNLRPFHNDEAVNAAILHKLWETGRYNYDPHQFHGPALYYLALPAVWLSGAKNYGELTETTLRSVPVVFGVGIVLLVVLLRDGLGRTATATAAGLLAISPAMAFYSRYFIHETLLVFFTGLVLGAGWRWAQTRCVSWAVACGAGTGLMFATKETCIVSLAAMCLAAMCVAWVGSQQHGAHTAPQAPAPASHCAIALGAAALVWVMFYSSFFANPGGIADSLRAFGFWIGHAGTQTAHVHPWHFYFERLFWYATGGGQVWTEGLIGVLALVGAAASLAGKWLGPVNLQLARFICVYTIILAAVYSLIPYKTPWCMLSPLHGMTLLGGIGATVLVGLATRFLPRLTMYVLLGAAAAHLCWQSWALNFRYFAHRTNPYVYAQTVPDILRLVDTIERISRVESGGSKMLIKVIAPEHDYWPLPWYLRRFEHVGWWDKIPDDPFAPVTVVASGLNASFDEKTQKRWLMVGLFELRPAVFFELYVQADLWERYVATLPRPQE